MGMLDQLTGKPVSPYYELEAHEWERPARGGDIQMILRVLGGLETRLARIEALLQKSDDK